MRLLLSVLVFMTSTALAFDGFLTADNHRLDVRIKETANSSFLFYSTNSSLDSQFTVLFHANPKGVIEYIPNVVLNTTIETFNVSVIGKSAGKTLVNTSILEQATHINVKSAFVIISVHHSDFLKVLSDIVGWTYFLAWSVSFYPQIYENWKRKSVIGLNFDFLSLNIVGFFLYSLFNIGLFAIPSIQGQYFKEHPQGVNPVELNDVIFSVHAVIACGITIIQCFRYERGSQSISKPCRFLHLGIGFVLAINTILAVFFVLSWLEFLYICSYVKLFITLVKYVPQAYMNYRRKSTMGWSIGNVLLDFTGGILSVLQMFLIAYNYDDWGSIFGDPTKFGLGLFSVLFDVFFILQHYVFYRGTVGHQPILTDQDEAFDVENASQNSSQG